MDGAVLFYFPFPGSAIGEKKPGTVFSSRKLSPTKAPNACVRARRREPREYRPGSLRGFREGELDRQRSYKWGWRRAREKRRGGAERPAPDATGKGPAVYGWRRASLHL